MKNIVFKDYNNMGTSNNQLKSISILGSSDWINISGTGKAFCSTMQKSLSISNRPISFCSQYGQVSIKMKHLQAQMGGLIVNPSPRAHSLLISTPINF